MKKDRNISEKYSYERKMDRLALLSCISGALFTVGAISLVVMGIICKMNFWFILIAFAVSVKCGLVASNNIYEVIQNNKEAHYDNIENNFNCFELTKEEITCLESTQKTLNKPVVVKKQQEKLDEETYKF